MLDLDGDGVQLTSYGSAPVLFDADNDGGSLEQTGWVSAQDGIVVHDLNGNGRIDNVAETLSEYYKGMAGSNGVAGTRPHADNVFNSADAAWSSLRVWVDANHDGKTDAGELKTFADLSITGISLATTAQSGEVRDGNEVLARGSFVQAGITKEAIAANFLANPAGASLAQTGSGLTVSTEGTAGLTSFVSQNTVATVHETLSAAALSVRHVTGGAGHDTIIGDAQANWLAGSTGADRLSGGAGDDVLLVDAADTFIDGGEGLDVVQVVGSAGVMLDMAESQVEIAVGGDGADTFVGGGRSSVFVRGGAGDDLIIGGAANDALSGEDGNDVIDGGAGNDLIRGHRGKDRLIGGLGDDVLDGGLEDDTLQGGSGKDVLTGGRGDDSLDGGDGIDVAEYAGSYADYRITRIADADGSARFRVVDTRSGADGADTLTNVEKLNGADWATNAGSHWNGGGMHVSHDYGFGKVDARAAARLAESWTEQNTAGNEYVARASSGVLNVSIPDGSGMVTRTFAMAAGVEVESAQVTLELDHQRWGDLIVKLVSPGGTESVLVNRPGKAPGSGASDLGDASSGTLSFSFNSTRLRGEQSAGNWTLQVIDAVTGHTGTLKNVRLDLYGSATDSNDVYVYTNEFAAFAGSTRGTLADSNGGRDTLNASAVTGNSILNLNSGSTSTLAGKALTLSGEFENAFGGDGSDTLTGNALNNVLLGGRGADTLLGGEGNDTLDGGRGNDVLTGGAGSDLFVIAKDAGAQDTIVDLGAGTAGSAAETIALIGFGGLDFAGLARTQVGTDTRLDLGEGQAVLLRNQQASLLSAAQCRFFDSQGALQSWQLAGQGGVAGAATEGDDLLQGTTGDDVIAGLGGNDTLSGNDGNDKLLGGSGQDALNGGAGDDVLVLELAGEGSDIVRASVTHTLAANVENLLLNSAGAIDGTGNALSNVLYAGAGDNVLDGLGGNDWVSYVYAGSAVTVSLASAGAQATGGSGTDTLRNIEYLFGSNCNDTLTGNSAANVLSGGLGNDVLIGGEGADLLAGGAGNDIYRFGRGSGQDTVIEDDTTSGNTDVLQFAPEISMDQLWFRQTGNHLEISIIGTTDRVTVNNWYSNSGSRIEQVQLSDGRILVERGVQQLVEAMAVFDVPPPGQSTLPPSYRDSLAPLLAANWT
ncbi:proprotein convertase P-domain-containing protein [Variovorax defluvii]|uniref:proprotein convertase P-domain-containing protein n=1 Tax=Variovorax defluvii TaxID=913761 RepID=UPI0031EE0772